MHEEIPSHRRVARDHAGVGEGHGLRHEASRRGGRLGVLRVTAPAMDAEHLAVAEALEDGDAIAGPAVGHARTDFGHDAHRIDAADMGKPHLALRLLAGAHGDIEHPVHRTGVNLDLDLARSGNGLGHILVMQHFGRTEFPIDHRLHDARTSNQ